MLTEHIDRRHFLERAVVLPLLNPYQAEDQKLQDILDPAFDVASLTLHETPPENIDLLQIQLEQFIENGYTPISVHDLTRTFDQDAKSIAGQKNLLLTLDDGLASQKNFVEMTTSLEQKWGISIPLLFAVITKFNAREDAGIPSSSPSYDDNVHNYLTRGDILHLLSVPHYDVANHTLNHSNLPSLSDSDLHGELAISKRRVEDLYHDTFRTNNPHILVYPNGRYDMRVIDAAQKYGEVDLAFATNPNLEYSRKDRFHLGRLGVS